ncbi:hypothetical protein [Sphingobacterium sp.]|uniref:hypothetical protein n=1 Tax=Sphingobacterium sp. TaxID=341027 RepID=UPI0031DDEC7F
MPLTDQKIEFKHSEEAEDVLSKMPSWLSKYIVIASILTIIVGLCFYLFFQSLSNKSETVVSVKLYPEVSRIRTNDACKIIKILKKDTDFVNAGDSIIQVLDIKSNAVFYLLAPIKGHLVLSEDIQEGVFLDKGYNIGIINKNLVKYYIIGSFKSNHKFQIGDTLQTKYFDSEQRAVITGNLHNRNQLMVTNPEKYMRYFISKDTLHITFHKKI